jgi:hypothetical protein
MRYVSEVSLRASTTHPPDCAADRSAASGTFGTFKEGGQVKGKNHTCHDRMPRVVRLVISQFLTGRPPTSFLVRLIRDGLPSPLRGPI